MDWAYCADIRRSSTKFVLVTMAKCADQSRQCWPSVQYLSDATAQDRKTVMENIKRLKDFGFITDTGQRRGQSGQVPVYLVNCPDLGTVPNPGANGSAFSGEASRFSQNTAPEASRFSAETVPKTAPLPTQKQDTPENGTVPFLAGDSPVFSGGQSRFSVGEVPKTGHGIIKENKKESPESPKKPSQPPPPPTPPTSEPKTARVAKTTTTAKPATAEFVLPGWIPADAWDGFIEMRTKKRNPPTARARQLLVAKLGQFLSDGHDLEAVLDNSTRNGWIDVYAGKTSQQIVAPHRPSMSGGARAALRSASDKQRDIANRLTGRSRDDFAGRVVDIN